MAQQIERVQPGDLIRSEYLNGIVEKLESLEARIAQLEATTPGGGNEVVIFEPNPSRTLRIGEPLKIVGKNFGLPAQDLVKLEEVFIEQFEPGSGDELLIIKSIPNVQNIPQDGRQVTLQLSTAKGPAQTKFTLAQPEVTIPTGTLAVARIGATPGNLTAGGSTTITYRITAITTLGDNYTVAPAISAAGWKAEYVNAQGNPILPSEVFIPKPEVAVQGSVADVLIKVTVPQPAGVNAGNLSLTVTSKKNPTGLAKTSEATPLTVGAPPPPPEPLALQVESVFPPLSGGGTAVSVPGSQLTAQGTQLGATIRVTIPGTFNGAPVTTGDYVISAITFSPNPNSLWSAVVSGQTTRSMTPPSSTFPIIITGRAGAATTKMTIKVTRQSDATLFGDQEIDITVT